MMIQRAEVRSMHVHPRSISDVAGLVEAGPELELPRKRLAPHAVFKLVTELFERGAWRSASDTGAADVSVRPRF